MLKNNYFNFFIILYYIILYLLYLLFKNTNPTSINEIFPSHN